MTRLPLAALALLAFAALPLAAQTKSGNAAPGGDPYLRSLEAQAPRQTPPQIDPAAQPLAQELAKRYDVRVLSAEPEDLGGKRVYRMVVMNPAGDSNGAFAVHTLIVDAASGELVPQFRNETSGYQLSAPPDRTPRDSGLGTTIRQESFSKLAPGA